MDKSSEFDLAGQTFFDGLLRSISQEYFRTLERNQELGDRVEALTTEVQELKCQVHADEAPALPRSDVPLPLEDEKPSSASARLGTVLSAGRWLGPGMQFRQTAQSTATPGPADFPSATAFHSSSSGKAVDFADPSSPSSSMRARFESNQSTENDAADFKGELVEHIGALLNSHTRNLEVAIEERFERMISSNEEVMDQIDTCSSVAEPKETQAWRRSLTAHDSALKAAAHHSASVEFDEDLSEEDFRRFSSQVIGTCRAKVKRLVHHAIFELTFATIILSNAVYLGVETDFMAKNPAHQENPPPVIYIIQYFYTVVFTIELVLRWFADGSHFLWCGRRNWAWNFLDTLTVVASLVESTFTTIHLVSKKRMEGMQGVGNVRLIRIIRVARLLRVFRISRILRFVSALRTLVYSIIGTLTSLFWAIVLLILIMYTFGVVFTQAAGDHLADQTASGDVTLESNDSSLQDYWGTLSTSMFTLFMSIAAGISWEHVVDPLSEVSWIWAALFSGFIAFTYFAVLNIVTANFCQSAIDSAQHDQEMIIHSVNRQKKVYEGLLKRLFRQVDDNNSGYISLKELELVFQNKDVRAYFSSLDLEPDDAWTLFKLLDADKGNTLDEQEFVAGCMRLRGTAKKLDLARLIEENTHVARQLSDFMAHADKQFEKLKNFTKSMGVPPWRSPSKASSFSRTGSKLSRGRPSGDAAEADRAKESAGEAEADDGKKAGPE